MVGVKEGVVIMKIDSCSMNNVKGMVNKIDDSCSMSKEDKEREIDRIKDIARKCAPMFGVTAEQIFGAAGLDKIR